MHEELGVTGYARNLADGRVEVLACGEAAAVQALCEWLWQGSPASHVTSVQVEVLEAGVPARAAGRIPDVLMRAQYA